MTKIHKIKWATLSVIAILFLILLFQNTGVISLRFMGWDFEVPRLILISSVGLGGFVAGVLSVLLVQRNQHQYSPASSDSSETFTDPES
ncbi:hypothetical protein N9406_03160 [Verrucomicrobiales bacterium]|jgi:uncharacterized integral membrane protein|nr:hypothetical protein [Verrucomicrobiales bacterium]MDA9922010.1 hypothetical protein [Verrucomicrobiales bacterium]MDB2497402.1 hypothetical protein [Verrucomicrobiales bacterium]MDB3939938.1 hypothetical protein [Verrucomicrobiales bacterium]